MIGIFAMCNINEVLNIKNNYLKCRESQNGSTRGIFMEDQILLYKVYYLLDRLLSGRHGMWSFMKINSSEQLWDTLSINHLIKDFKYFSSFYYDDLCMSLQEEQAQFLDDFSFLVEGIFLVINFTISRKIGGD